MIIFLNQPGLGALGQRGAANSPTGELKIWCQDNKKRRKVNKNNSKCTCELKARI